MIRTRTQKGEVYRKGQKWYLRYFDFRVEDGQLQRKRLCRPLGSFSDFTKQQAREEAKNFLATINNATLAPENARKLTDFVDSVYMPDAQQRLRPSTYRGYEIIWRALKPFCQDLWIRDVKTFHLQNVLKEMGRTDRFNKNTMAHVKMFLSGVFVFAAQQGFFFGVNPVTDTSIPKVRAQKDTHAYSLEEILKMVTALPEPAATMIFTAAFTGARRGELRGMKWENYHDGHIAIRESIWNGITGDTKSRQSKRDIPIIRQLATKWAALRESQRSPIAGPVFPNGKGKAVDPDSVLRRVILPVLEAISIQWHGWHAFRRGAATNLKAIGVDDLTISQILGHSDVSVTRRNYIKTVNENAVAAMQKLEEKLESALNATQLPPIQKVQPIKGVM
jgi:integrase